MLGHKTLGDDRGGVVGQILSEMVHDINHRDLCGDVNKTGNCCVCISRLSFHLFVTMSQKQCVHYSHTGMTYTE